MKGERINRNQGSGAGRQTKKRETTLLQISGIGHQQKKRRKVGPVALSLVLLLTMLLSTVPSMSLEAADAWKQAIEPRHWRFPRDHGGHPEYRTEWWYFTGNLTDGGKHKYGYQLTFFRQGIAPEPEFPASKWAVRDLYLAHFTITDIDGGRFSMSERVSRTGPGLAGSSVQTLDAWLFSWSARFKDGAILLDAREGDGWIELELTPRKPVVLHGKNGLSQKGPKPGQASHYASLTDLATSGRMKVPGNDRVLQVRGISWFDHEFGSNQLSSDQIGWDWFGLHLSDGRDLMLYLMRRRDGSIDASSGTLVEPNGQTKQIYAGDMVIEATRRWKSPKSKGSYPAGWTIRLPKHQVNLDVQSLVANQELITNESTGITYWEGVVSGKGKSKGRPVGCEGYAELTGYADSLHGVF